MVGVLVPQLVVMFWVAGGSRTGGWRWVLKVLVLALCSVVCYDVRKPHCMFLSLWTEVFQLPCSCHDVSWELGAKVPPPHIPHT